MRLRHSMAPRKASSSFSGKVETEHPLEPKRPNKERLSWQSAAYVLLVVMACCFAILGAAAQQPPAAQAPSMAQTPPPAPQSVAAPGQEGEQGPESLHIVVGPVSYTHLRAHETVLDLVC